TAESHSLGVVGLTRRLLSCLLPYRAEALLILLAMLVELAFYTFFALSFKILIDGAIVPRDSGLLVRIVGLLVAGFLVAVLASVSRLYLTASVGAKMLNALRLQLFEKLQELSLDFFGRTSSGELLSRFASDLAAVENATVRAIPTATQAGLQLAISVVLLFALDWRLAALTLLTLPLAFVGPKLLGPRATQASYQRGQDDARVVSTVQEQLAARQVVRAFGLEAV